MSLHDEDKQWILQQLERVETALLTEFHKSGSPNEARQRAHTVTLHALDLGVEVLNDRVDKLERNQ